MGESIPQAESMNRRYLGSLKKLRLKTWNTGRRSTSLVLLGLVLLLSGEAIHGQETGRLTGSVAAAATGEEIAASTVLIIETKDNLKTGRNGLFEFELPVGTYTLLVTRTGYWTQVQEVEVVSGENLNLVIRLDRLPSQFGEELVVIGSRAERTALETPVPVDVLSVEDLEQSGMSETGRMIQYLAPSFNMSTSAISDGTDIVRPMTLRGLGPDQTLVLINGKRRHSSALVHVNGSIGRGTAGVDLNAIPASAIERIEILRDGAAAQYGSDAIAGVINVVLRTNSDKTRVVLNTGQHYAGDGEVMQASVNHGWKLGDHGFFNVTAEYRDRGYTNRAGKDPRRIFNFLEQEAGEPALSTGTLDPREATYDRLNHRYGDAESENGYLFINGEIPLSDDSEFYFFGGVSERDGESAGFNRLPSQSRTNVQIFPEGHLPLINTTADDLSISAGYRRRFANNWAMDAGVVTGENEFNFLISNSANTSLGAGSPTEADAGTLKFDQTAFTVDLFGSVNWGLTNPVAIALGLEYREDGYDILAGEPASYTSGGALDQFGGPAPAGIQVFPGFQPVNEVAATRDNVAAYVDIELQPTDKLNVGLASRFEEYSDFGSTLVGKIAARYAVKDSFALRASVSTGFRAPSLHQSNLANISTQFVDVDGALVPIEVGTFRNPSPLTEVLGVPQLGEETSTSYSIGFTSRPVDHLSVTVDAFKIDIDDRIVLSGRFSDTISQIAPLLQSIGVGSGQFFVNALDTETEGLDIVVAYSTKTGLGRLDLTAAANWNNTDIAAIKTPPLLQGLGETLFNEIERVYVEEAQPGQLYNLSGRYSLGPVAGLVRFNFFGEVAATESATDPSRKQVFGGKWITDLDLSYKFRSGMKIHVGANNIFDVFPDKNIPENSFNGIFVYPRRTAPFGFNGGYFYTKVGWEF
jgi:iron complex outermembrane receptor protein